MLSSYRVSGDLIVLMVSTDIVVMLCKIRGSCVFLVEDTGNVTEEELLYFCAYLNTNMIIMSKKSSTFSDPQ